MKQNSKHTHYLLNVSIVTVTYGNRIEYLEKVIYRAIELGISKCCIVVNGSDRSFFSHLLKLENIYIIFNDDNLGSAKGFKQGIEYLYRLNTTEYIWLLDDDNLPDINALSSIDNYITHNTFLKSKDALLSYRPDRSVYLDSINNNNGAGMLKDKNSALGFSLFTNKSQIQDYSKYGLVVAPYGGLFFHKKLIDTIGYPDESYFLYGDDFDFSIRIPKMGGKIRLVKESVLIDLEKSFHLRIKKFYETRFHNTKNNNLIFYSVRNSIVFELNHQVTSLIKYSINLLIYSLIISFLLLITLNFNKCYYFTKGIILGYIKGIKFYKQ